MRVQIRQMFLFDLHFPQTSKLSDSLHFKFLTNAHLFYSCGYCASQWKRASAKCLNCKELLEQETSVNMQTESDDEWRKRNQDEDR